MMVQRAPSLHTRTHMHFRHRRSVSKQTHHGNARRPSNDQMSSSGVAISRCRHRRRRMTFPDKPACVELIIEIRGLRIYGVVLWNISPHHGYFSFATTT